MAEVAKGGENLGRLTLIRCRLPPERKPDPQERVWIGSTYFSQADMDGGTAVAQIAEVGLRKSQTSAIAVRKIIAVMHCGLVINLDGARAQLERNAMWGLSATLLESLRKEEGRIIPANFDLYPIFSLEETSEIHGLLYSAGDLPFGVGEPRIGPVPAAIANARFALNGQRVRPVVFFKIPAFFNLMGRDSEEFCTDAESQLGS